MSELTLAFGLSFEALYSRDGIAHLDGAFVTHLADVDAGLHARFLASRSGFSCSVKR